MLRMAALQSSGGGLPLLPAADLAALEAELGRRAAVVLEEGAVEVGARWKWLPSVKPVCCYVSLEALPLGSPIPQATNRLDPSRGPG